MSAKLILYFAVVTKVRGGQINGLKTKVFVYRFSHYHFLKETKLFLKKEYYCKKIVTWPYSTIQI